MNRHVVAGMLGLALAGCTPSRTATNQARPGLLPGGYDTLPSIHETINTSPSTADAATRQAGVVSGPRPAPFAGLGAGSPRPLAGTPQPAAAALETRQGVPPTVPMQKVTLDEEPADAGKPPAVATAASHPSVVIPKEPWQGPPMRNPADQTATTGHDPLLGAHPDAAPAMALPPPVSTTSMPPVADPFRPLPPSAEPPAIMPAPAVAPPPAAVPAELPTAITPSPAAAAPPESPPPTRLEALPPVELAPPSAGSTPAAAQEKPPSAPDPATAPADAPKGGTAGGSASAIEPKRDPSILTVAADPTEVRSAVRPRDLKEAGKAAARVNDEVITMHDLTSAYKARLRKLPPGMQLPKDQKIMLVREVLEMLIERNMLVQEAKREIKSPKQLQLFMSIADRAFTEEEIPPLLRQSGARDEIELKQKFAENGQSLDELRETYRNEFLAKGYLEQKLSHKMKVELPEMRDYYNAHIADFNTGAQVVWREVLIEVDKSPSRAEARRKADAVLARLKRGEEFAEVARAESDGPNKARGGLWETAPGSYSVAAVNVALDSWPLRQIGPIIEGPSSFHIIRVESRRPAGPATFAEVQDKLKRAIRKQKVEKESTDFLSKLRARTLVTSILDEEQNASASNLPATASSR